jgi:hypothetical protein
MSKKKGGTQSLERSRAEKPLEILTTDDVAAAGTDRRRGAIPALALPDWTRAPRP